MPTPSGKSLNLLRGEQRPRQEDRRPRRVASRHTRHSLKPRSMLEGARRGHPAWRRGLGGKQGPRCQAIVDRAHRAVRVGTARLSLSPR